MIGRTPLTVLEESELKQLKFDQLFEKNIPLAKHIAYFFWRAGWLRNVGSLEDVFQEAYLALLNAIRKFNPKHEHANWQEYLSQAIRRHLRMKNMTEGVIKTPVYAVNKRHPKNTGASYEAATHAKNLRNIKTSFGDSHDEIDELTYNPSPDTTIIQEELQNLIHKLPEGDRFIIENHFGLVGDRKTLNEIGQVYGISRERVRQKQKRILKMLRERLEGKSAAA